MLLLNSWINSSVDNLVVQSFLDITTWSKQFLKIFFHAFICELVSMSDLNYFSQHPKAFGIIGECHSILASGSICHRQRKSHSELALAAFQSYVEFNPKSYQGWVTLNLKKMCFQGFEFQTPMGKLYLLWLNLWDVFPFLFHFWD